MISPRRLITATTAGVRWRLRRWISGPKSEQRARLAFEKERVLANLRTTPDFFPMKLDVEHNVLDFVQMSRESFRQSVFLDNRAVRSGPRTLSAELTQLQLLSVQPERPLHFVLHGAFCGSTLLARYLEELPHCFVLKEPLLLGQLAGLKNNGPGTRESDLWDDWFKMTMVLLSRAYPSDAAVIVKAPDRCNWMGRLLLDHDGRTKIVFLSSPLKVFLLQALKADDRRKWVREQLLRLKYSRAQVPFLSEIAVTELSDGKCAAALWLLNSFLCDILLARRDSNRVFLLNGEDLICQPQHVSCAIANFFGLTSDEATRAALATFRPLPHHSKDRRRPYDAAARARELDDAEARCSIELHAAMRWASLVSDGWLSRSPFPVE
jgi:hypothetical protein